MTKAIRRGGPPTPALEWLELVVELGEQAALLADGDGALIRRCFATKGPRAGRLLHQVDRWRDPALFAAHQALLSTLCPARTSVGGLLMLEQPDRAVFERIDTWSMWKIVRTGLNAFGQGSCEFNLWHLDHEVPSQARFCTTLETALLRLFQARAFA